MLTARIGGSFRRRCCISLPQVEVSYLWGTPRSVRGMNSSCEQGDKCSWTKPQCSSPPPVLKLYNSLTKTKVSCEAVACV